MDSKPSIPCCSDITGHKDRETVRAEREWEAAKIHNQNLWCAKNRAQRDFKDTGKSGAVESVFRHNYKSRRDNWTA